jgi:hypothetical protein
MDILYISPDFAPNYANFVRNLHAAGLRVWSIGEADFFAMPADLRACIRWYVHNEQWLRLEGFINERLGVPGITLQDTERLKKKSVMKRIFHGSALPVARGGRVTDLDEALRLAGDLGYPVILKPDEEMGVGGTHRVGNAAELASLSLELAPGYLLEEFIDAPVVTYDGLTSLTGEVLFENTLVYGEGPTECTRSTDTFFYVGRSIPARLSEIGKSLVAAFGIRRKFFHFEFFVQGEDYVPIEINSRPPRGAILDMMNYSVDGDLYRAWACMMAGRAAEVPAAKKYVIGYVGRQDKSYTFSHAEILARFGHCLVEFAENPPVFSGGMGRYRYIFRSENEAEIRDIAAAVRQAGQAS